MDLNYHFNNYSLFSTSSSQYGLAKGCRLREQWSNGSLLKSISSGSVALPGFLPPKKYFHSWVVKYNLSDWCCFLPIFSDCYTSLLYLEQYLENHWWWDIRHVTKLKPPSPYLIHILSSHPYISWFNKCF